MIGLMQRVTHSSVVVEGETVGAIEQGLMVLIGVEREDDKAKADRLLERLLSYRVFEDDNGKMNLSVSNIQGGLLLVPQFTLVADTKKGTRPGFSAGASSEHGKAMFEYLCEQAKNKYPHVATGVFGADMKVRLLNDGPVTFWLQV